MALSQNLIYNIGGGLIPPPNIMMRGSDLMAKKIDEKIVNEAIKEIRVKEQRERVKKYDAKQGHIRIRIEPEKKEKLEAYVKDHGIKSVNACLVQLIDDLLANN